MDQTASVLPFPHAPDGIELRHLRAFVAVAEELNFGRAAERLYVSQPALSRQIRALEQLVGCELLRRSTHSVELTLAGEALLDRARQLLRDVDEAVAAALAVGGELLGRVARTLEPMRGMVANDPDLVQARATFESMNAQFAPPAGTVTRPVTAGGVPSLVVSPAVGHEPTVLYLHGGGYVVGSAFGYQPHAGALAAAAQTGILVPDYRLAPEHPFPAALEDSRRSYLWLRGQARDPEGIVVAGDSAGAGLLLSLLLALKRDGQPLPAAVVILCPWIDLTGCTPSASDAPLASDEDVRRCVEAYLSGHPADDPIVDPLRADLSGLPPMLIQAATGDARLADAKALAGQAQDHGVDARLELFPVEAHAFQLFWSFLPEAADAMEAAGAFIREIGGEAERTARDAAGSRG
ncbi:MAG TPA: alpha/beta hydrolase fold domain-containing protein [Solirubrobacteraceae bacterium]|nr:alpha/beta hydrolase fold domain-containing protein [Solirubrobacteraceae bacterium]